MAPWLPHLCACLLSVPPFVPPTSLHPSSEYCSLVLQALQLEDTIQNSKREGSRRFESSLRAPRQGAFALLLDVAGELQGALNLLSPLVEACITSLCHHPLPKVPLELVALLPLLDVAGEVKGASKALLLDVAGEVKGASKALLLDVAGEV